MASLKTLRHRISSINSTIKITSAMKMVAASKLKRLQEQKDLFSPYKEYFENMMQETFFQSDALEADLSWFKLQESHKVAIVVLSASKGLCGPFNNSVIKETKVLIQKLKKQDIEPELFFIGRRAKDALNQKFSQYYAKGNFESVEQFLSCEFLKGKYQSIQIIFNQYKSVISQKTVVLDLLPFSIAPEQKFYNGICQIEPDASELLQKMAPRYFEILMLEALVETRVGEQASRMIAMDSATRSAKEMLDRLKLELNRSRQALITKELIEVISGSEASV